MSSGMSRPGALRAIFGKELRQAWRDRSLLLLILVVPLALAGITSVAFGQLASGPATKIGLVDGDRGPVAAVLMTEVLPHLANAGGKPLITIVRLVDAAAARSAVHDGRVSVAILIPAGFSAAVQAGTSSQLTLVTGANDGIGEPVASSVLHGFTAQLGTNQLSLRLVSADRGGPPDAQLVGQANAQRSPVRVADALSGTHTLTARSFFAPAMVVLALFFCGQMVARGLVAERDRRTLARMVLADVAPWRILAAKYAAALLVGALSASVVLGTFGALGARFGAVWVLALLVLCSSAAMISVSALVVLLARNEEQAGTFGTVAAFVLAIIGGNFIPLSQTPKSLADVAMFTPNGWAVRGFADLSVATGSPIRAVLPALLVLAGFTVLAGVPAMVLSRRAVGAAGA
ncbi:MAG TPA: ABC transporter permease [Rugosimonospora sp.]|nr:ABC transporter permease [Rugosimonospora sp.]